MTQLSSTAAALPPKRPLSVDGVRRRQAVTPATKTPPVRLQPAVRRPQQMAPAQATAPLAGTATAPAKRAPAKPLAQPAAPRGSKKAKRQQLYLVLALLAGGVGGFLIQAVWFGVAVIAVYGVAVFIMRIPSRTTFALAGVSIATISSLFLFKPSTALASNFATYTFMLLVIGVVSLVREAQSPSVRSLRDRNRRH